MKKTKPTPPEDTHNNISRRVFLRQSATTALVLAGGTTTFLAGCTTSPYPINPPFPLPEGNPGPFVPNPAKIITTTKLSATANKIYPWCMGQVFKPGDLPLGSQLDGIQCTVKSRWSDGSAKIAILASITAVNSTGSDLPIGIGSTPTGKALSLTSLKALGITAQIETDLYSSSSWSGTDWDSPFQTWVTGPVMSSWIYRKTVGTDAHLTAWLEVRLWANGALEVLPWIENGYVNIPQPTNKNATYTFTLGGKQRFSANIDLKHHQRTPLMSGTALSYWLAEDPAVTPRHDTLYLQATELVPTYDAQVSASAPAVSTLAASYQPLQAGNFNYDYDDMASAGYQDPIGLLPQHDVLYLVCNAAVTYSAVVRNGYSAGRYGIHYRDENTFRPLRFSQHPTRVIGDSQGFKDNGSSSTGTVTPTPTGGNPPGWDIAHSPSVGYLAYLLTGRWYFMEEVQFAATANYLGNGDNLELRTGAKGLVQTAPGAWQTRSCAWDWRSKVQALTVTPDADTALRTEFINCVEANIDHFHSRYVAQPNNPFGWILPGDSDYKEMSIWQQDFVTAVFGWAVSLDLPIAATAKTNLMAFFQWKAKSVVMRLGTSSGFWYINAAMYTIKTGITLTPSSFTTGNGPWPVNDAAVYAATISPTPSWLGNTEGTLAGEFGIGSWCRGMWGNLQPAISYAVRHGVTGALEAYTRMTTAQNWSTLRAGFDTRPVWGIKPASITNQTSTLPSWAKNAPLDTFIAIPNTMGAGGAPVDAYSGIGVKNSTSELIISAAGGHNNSSDNRTVSIALNVDAPTWVLRKAASPTTGIDVGYNPDGQPASMHTYHSTIYTHLTDRVMRVNARFTFPNASGVTNNDGFNLATNTWDGEGYHPLPPAGYGFVGDADGYIWTSAFQRYDPVAKTWSAPITKRTATFVRFPAAFDSKRRQIFTLQYGDGQGYNKDLGVQSSRVPIDGDTQYVVSFNASSAYTQFQSDGAAGFLEYIGMDYDPANDRFLVYGGQGIAAGRVYIVTPTTGNQWEMDLMTLGAGSLIPAGPLGGSGIQNRFRYLPALKGFVLLARASDNLYFLRVA